VAELVADRPLLEGRGLVKRYGGVVAVDEADIVLSAGEILGLVGPNGAGKTTLVDLVSGAQSSDAGTLTLAGRSLGGTLSRRARAGLSRTFQYPQLALDLTVRQNLALGRMARRAASPVGMVRLALAGVVGTGARDREDADAVESIAREARVGDIDRRCGDLTLGEQRLAEVARALIQDPLVMLLDEPFAGADANGVAGISEAIRAVRDSGHGVILVDHNVDLVASLVDRIMLLDQGRVVFDGDPGECLRSEEMQRVYFGTADASVGPVGPVGDAGDAVGEGRDDDGA
jgi:branched-chain amino acid transport system ATP-binding protein